MYKLNENAWFEESEEYIESLKLGSNKPVTPICPLCGKVRESGRFNNYTKEFGTRCRSCSKMAKINGEIGQVFNGVIILSIVDGSKRRDGRKESNVYCLCSCGEKFVAPSRHIKSGAIKSCGCLPRFLVGENHPSYDHSKTTEERELQKKKRRNPEYKMWSRQVKREFGYICFICGGEEKLVSHHIEGFMSRPELRFDVYNGVCLCDDCHKEYHYDFMGGTQNSATKTSFVAFMEYKICQHLRA